MSDRPGLDFSLRLTKGRFHLAAQARCPGYGMTGLYGPSGSGKTTLLRCLAGLEAQADGRVQFGDHIWQDRRRGIFVPPEQRGTGFVFQDSRLFPHLSVAANLEYAQRRRRSGAEARHDLDALLGIGRLRSRVVTTLSGGEQRRVAIARALSGAPQLLLLDEPLTGLDGSARSRVADALGRVDTLPLPAIFVSHDLDDVIALCDYMIVLHDGSVRTAGPVGRLLSDSGLVGEDRFGVLVDAEVGHYDSHHGLTSLSFAGGTLRVPGELNGHSVRVQVRARDVSLCRSVPVDTSILNTLPATVTSLDIEEDLACVGLQVKSTRLLAQISRFSLNELGLEPGSQVIAQIKGVAVRPARWSAD